jgi:hypothetical protein
MSYIKARLDHDHPKREQIVCIDHAYIVVVVRLQPNTQCNVRNALFTCGTTRKSSTTLQHPNETAMCRPFAVVLLVAIWIKQAVSKDVIASVSNDAKGVASLFLNPAESGVEITKASFVGDAAQLGTYAQVGDLFKDLPTTGTILSSGKVEDVKTTGIPYTSFDNSPGDADLNTVLRTVAGDYSTLDAAVLSVEVKVSRPVTIKVAYVFGSANLFERLTNFPDVVGLFLNSKNVALIGDKPVSTASVYCGGDGLGNCGQLISSSGGTSLKGYTATQVVTLDLPTGTHQLKVAVADGVRNSENRSSDSAVFLSFVGAVKAPTAAPVKAPTAAPVSVPPPVKPPGKMMAMMTMM